MSYYMHRISHEWSVSKALLDLGYLSVGWSELKNEKLVGISEEELNSTFESIFLKYYDKNRNRNCLKRFLSFKGGDVILVPLYGGMCAIVTIMENERVHSIIDLPEDIKSKVGFKESTELGFYIKFDPTRVTVIPRNYTDEKLQSRMKYQMTNTEIDDLKEKVVEAMSSTGPLNLLATMQSNVENQVLESIKKINPQQMEKLVAWYFKRRGANAIVLPKWTKNKKDKEDADIQATFEDLNIVFYIQAKKHEGETSDSAVDQIDKYRKRMEENQNEDEGCCNDVTNFYWVISTADGFSDDAIQKAMGNNIRLIDGKEFSRMIMNVGIQNINEII